MKKIKLLTPIILSTTMLGGVTLSIAGCSCTKGEQTYIVAAEKDVKIVGNDMYTYLTFTLENELGDDVLTSDLPSTQSDYFTYGDLEVTGKLVKIPVVWKVKDTSVSVNEKVDAAFTCCDKDGNQKWIQIIRDCTVTYSPQIVLEDPTSGREILTTTSDGNQMTGSFKFKLSEPLEDDQLVLEPAITDTSSDYQLIYPHITIDETDKTSVTLTLSAQRTDAKALAAGDKFEFSCQIKCVYGEKKYTYWESPKLTNFSMSYDVKEIDIDDDAFVLSSEPDESGGYTLLSLDTSKIESNCNTLLIPAKASSEKWIRTIGNGTEPLNLPSTITKIKFEGIGVQKIAAGCFYGNTNIKYIDIASIGDSVKSLDSALEFGSLSFYGLSEKGAIIWNNGLSKYKQAIFKQKFYNAGLYYPVWFGFTVVTTEAQLRECAYVGANIQLGADIEIAKKADYTGEIDFHVDSIVDLNGYTISCAAPIYNTEKAEYAVIGVWDCEVLFTDSSDGTAQTHEGHYHDGGVTAYDQSNIVYETAYPAEGESNDYWEWQATDKNWKPRETRCFYCRSDIPARSKGSLEITAGKYYGNCTTIFNYNTICYIEHFFIKDDETSYDTYKGTYAPEFHVLSPYLEVSSTKIPETGIVYTTPTRELLNCKEATFQSGEAYFLTYGGKYFASLSSKSTVAEPLWYYFDPSNSIADKTTSGECAHWTQYEGIDIAYDVVKMADDHYNLVRPLGLTE